MAFVNVTNSTTLGTLTNVAGVTLYDTNVRYLTLDNAVDFDWPREVIDYYISFESDQYTLEYQVFTRTDNTITIVDSENTSPIGAGLNWVLRGKPKNEVLDLVSYVIHYQFLSDTQKTFDSGESGDNA